MLFIAPTTDATLDTLASPIGDVMTPQVFTVPAFDHQPSASAMNLAEAESILAAKTLRAQLELRGRLDSDRALRALDPGWAR